MRVGQCFDGREVTYDEANIQFAVGGTLVTTEQILEYDELDQIQWVSEQTRDWARELREPKVSGISEAETVAAAGTDSTGDKGWFARLPIWGKILFVVIWPVSVAYGLYWMWRDQKYSQGLRIALTAGAALMFVIALAGGGGDASTSDRVAAPADSKPAVSAAQEAPTPVDSKPAPAPEPEFTEEEEAYAAEVCVLNVTLGEASAGLSEVLQVDPIGVLTGGDSMYEAALYAAVIQGSYEQGKELVPPLSMKAIHDKWLSALKDYHDAMDHLANGIDNIDTAEMEKATELMLSGADKVSEATILLQEFQATRQ